MMRVAQAVTPAEQTLIKQAQQGERQAFAELVSLHRSGVLNVVYRMCGDVHLAEDIAQETFIKVWQKLPAYRPTASFRGWVYRIATNATLDVFRREKETLDVDALHLADQGIGMENRLAEKQRAEQIRQAILALPVASRSVLVLREYEGLSYKEIAETLEVPVGTVMSRLNYARGKLREALAGMLEEV